MSDEAMRTLGVRLPDKTWARLDAAAARRPGKLQKSHVIRMAIDAFLDADEAAAGKAAPAAKPAKPKK